MRADRLLSMMLLLQKNKRMTAQDLAQELEVSERTIYRDIDALSISGIPIYTQSGTHGGIFLDENYRLSLTGLSKQQVISLFMSSEAGPLADIGMERNVKDGMLKLFHSLPSVQQNEIERMQQRLYIDPVGWFNFGDTSDYLGELQDAVWQDRQVKMSYQPHYKAPYDLCVDAYAIVSKADKWYLVGRKASGDFRTYRLTQIKQLQALETHFERAADFDLMTYWQESQHNFQQQMDDEFPSYPVELRIHSNLLWYVSHYLSGRFEQLSPLDEDKYCRIRVQFRTDYEAQANLLAMGLYADIISPEELKVQIRDLALEIAKHHA